MVNTAGDDKPLIVAMAEVYVVMCHETGTTEAGWVECDVMRGGNTGGCTLIIGNKFMRKQAVGMHFSDESGERAQVNETPQLGVAGCGRVWLGVAGCGWVWLGLAGFGWVWLGLAGFSWF